MLKRILLFISLLLLSTSYLSAQNLYMSSFLLYKKGIIVYSLNKYKGSKILKKSLSSFLKMYKTKSTDPIINYYIGNIYYKLYYQFNNSEKLIDSLKYLSYSYQNGTTKAICPLLSIKLKLSYPTIEIQNLINSIKKDKEILNYCKQNYPSLKNYLK